MSFPFTQKESEGCFRRTFSGAVDVDELIWHRDLDDREITVIRSNGWYLQMDDELPVSMHPGDVFHIPREKWHRVIRKGNNDLVVEIKVVQT